jgi:hypothetical protein
MQAATPVETGKRIGQTLAACAFGGALGMFVVTTLR